MGLRDFTTLTTAARLPAACYDVLVPALQSDDALVMFPGPSSAVRATGRLVRLVLYHVLVYLSIMSLLWGCTK